MDLGLQGKTAIVCASSAGLGLGCALALAEEGVNLVLNGRDADRLALAEAQARAVAGNGASVVAIAADVTTEAGRAALLDAAPTPDILVNNAGGPPPGDFTCSRYHGKAVGAELPQASQTSTSTWRCALGKSLALVGSRRMASQT